MTNKTKVLINQAVSAFAIENEMIDTYQSSVDIDEWVDKWIESKELPKEVTVEEAHYCNSCHRRVNYGDCDYEKCPYSRPKS